MTNIPQTILDKIEQTNLPSIPKVLLGFLRLVDDDNASMAELADLVRRDPALTARILTIANSPALRQLSECRTIEKCLSVIGITLLRTIAACLAIQSVFSKVPNERDFNFRGFWRHCLLVSEIAREIAINIDHDDMEEAYLSALLHDTGQLLLLSGLGEEYGTILDSCHDEESLLAAEKHLLNTDHAAVGSWLINRWDFSTFMADAVRFHHFAPDQVHHADQLIQIVWSAHAIAAGCSPDKDVTAEQTPDLIASMNMLGLDSPAIQAIYLNSCERVTRLGHELGIDDGSSKSIPHSTVPPADGLKKTCISVNAAQSEIEDKVRNMALMQPLLMNLLRLCDEALILLSLREASKILFDLGEPSFLLVRDDKPVLSGANILGQPELLQRLNIRLSPENSLAADAILENRALSTFDAGHCDSVPMVDIQLARILGSDGLLYIPMNSNNHCKGLIVYKLGLHQHAGIQRQLAWIVSFAHIAALSIETCRSIQKREQKLVSDLQVQFEQQARKVIHESGNPLGIIKNYLNIVSSRLPDEQAVRNELGIISEEIDRVTQIVRQLNQPKPDTGMTGSFDINKLIEGMLSLYGESLFTSRGIFIKKALDPSLVPMDADRNIVKQVLLNIWKNGSEAMQTGGCFIISTRDSVNLDGEYYAEIQMSDSGPGLPPDVASNIFEPLVPERKPGHYGIGLSIVDALVKQLNGLIFFHSNPGVGTSFSILLPRAYRAEK